MSVELLVDVDPEIVEPDPFLVKVEYTRSRRRNSSS